MRLKKLAALFLTLSAALFAARFGIEHIGRIVRLSDPADCAGWQIHRAGRLPTPITTKIATTRNWC